jgi:acyl-coenzyme A thioesterase PaaI-like protein
MTQYDPAAAGWRTMPGAALPSGIGIPWSRRVEGLWHYGLLTDDDHGNPNGVVHGLSMLAWEAAERTACTTIQLNTHFLDAIHPGEFIELRGEVTRRTRGLVFVRGVIGVLGKDSQRDVGAVDGIWRVLRPR